MATIQDIAKYAQVSPSTVSRILKGKTPFSDSAKRRVDEAVAALGYTSERKHTTTTIKDVAKLAGVSISTVSNVMNNHTVSEESKQKVLDAAKELNYKPNMMGRNLRRENNRTIIVATSAPVEGILKGVYAAANEFDHDIILMYTNINKREDYIDRMETETARGIIFVNFPDYAALRELSQRYSVVQCGEYVEEFDTNVVSMDYERSAYELVMQLVNQGRKRFLLILPSMQDDVLKQFLRAYTKGFLSALKDNNLEISDKSVIDTGEDGYSNRYEVHERLFNSIFPEGEPLPDAVISASNVLATVFTTMMQNRGISVPDDIAVATLQEGSACFRSKPYVTAVSQSNFQMGYESVKLLIQEINSDNTEKQTILLPHSIILRGSTNKELYPFDERSI